MNAPTTDPRRRRRAVIALLTVTILWGCTFVWSKQSLDAAEARLGHPGGAVVIALYVAVRFTLAAGLIALWPRSRRGLDAGAWRGGFALVSLPTGAALAIGGNPGSGNYLTSLEIFCSGSGP